MATHDDFWDRQQENFLRDYPNTDLYLYMGRIKRPYDDEFIGDFEKRTVKQKNLIVIMTTLGGDPDAAYRIGRCIQRNYGLLPGPQKGGEPENQVAIFVDTVCGSAGTLVSFSGTEIIMTDYGELSPIDIQIRKPDDVWERDSGLTPTQALDILERRSKSLFKAHFGQLRLDNELALTTKTSVEVASNITTGLLSPIYGQIDPIRLGEIERLMGITAAYGERLGKYSLKQGALAKLLSGYPSHGFVIDRCEADDLFKKVSIPKPSLKTLGEFWRPFAQQRLTAQKPSMLFMFEEPKMNPSEEDIGEDHGEQQNSGGSGTAPAGPRPRRGTTGKTGKTASGG